ncbi:MAG: ATP-binding protein [Solirubrobacterales bacterium]
MDLSLDQVAAGWPLAASLAALTVRGAREERRRRALNEHLHELRRPLQALALAAPRSAGSDAVGSSLRLATDALQRLDGEINGGSAPAVTAPVPLEPLLRSSLARWRARAELGGSSVQLRWRAGEAVVAGDAGLLEQALDNLLVNAIEHGGAAIVVEARWQGASAVVAVIDTGPRTPRRRPAEWLGRRPDRRRHGHGLKVVRRIAAEHGGGFELRRSPGRTEALLRLPALPAPLAVR